MNSNPIDWSTAQARLHAALRSTTYPLRLHDTPEFPLAFNVPMPIGFDFPNGHLSASFNAFIITNFDSPNLIDKISRQTDETAHATLQWGEISVTGHYVIGAKEAPIVSMDTAGNLLDLTKTLAPLVRKVKMPFPRTRRRR